MARKHDGAAVVHPTVDEAQVVAWLRGHPDMLIRHPELALALSPPSRFADAEGVVDMQVFMIERLQEELDRVKGAAEHLIHTSRSNMSTQNRTHQAVLALLTAETLGQLAQAVADDLPPLLDVDVAALAFEESAVALPVLAVAGIERIPAGMVARVMGGDDRDCALFEELPGDPLLFGDGAGLVTSSAVVRLSAGGQCPAGLLSLGSRHSRTFHPGQGTDLIAFLARVAETCIRRFVG
ncbi:MAG: DUF484 family protein [Magnetospirillum sp.]|nr:DUF484 family protein [Magnetospirillum sp.]